MKLVIAKEEDRITVAGILIKNGYTVRQGRQKKEPSKKAIEYFLDAVKGEDQTDGSESAL